MRQLSCRSDGAVQGRARALPLALACLFMGGATFAARAIPEDEALLLVKKLRRVLLPLGWEITGTKPRVAPGDWHTFDPVGFLVEGRKGDDAFSVWFLPADWIGIRKVDHRAPRNYWEGVLGNTSYKTIAISTEKRVPGLLRELEFPPITEGNVTYSERLRTASLNNSGWWRAERVFRDRFGEAQEIAERLIEQYCPDEASRDEAAYSLIVLGVPAKGVFLERALKGEETAREACLFVLTYFGGEDSVDVLCRTLEDQNAPRQCRHAAAGAVGRIGDVAAGPSLVAALRDPKYGHPPHGVIRAIGEIGYEAAGPKLIELLGSVTNPYSLSDIARAIERIGYRPAAPKLLSVLVAAEDHSLQVACADALATLRYTEAVPAIRDLAGDEQAKNRLGKTAEEALIRLTTPLGEPSAEARLILVAPRDAVAGKAVNTKFYVENLTNRNIDVTEYVMADGTLVVNGERRENRCIVGAWGTSTALQPVRAWAFDYDLSQEITTLGRYSVKYEVRGAISNKVTFDVRGAQ